MQFPIYHKLLTTNVTDFMDYELARNSPRNS